MKRLALKKERKRKKIEREQRKKDQQLVGTPNKKKAPAKKKKPAPKKKATPKRKKAKKTPKGPPTDPHWTPKLEAKINEKSILRASKI